LSGNDLDLGMAALRAGRWEEGIGRLRAVLAGQPGFAELWSNLGFALREAGRPDEAREALERAVQLKPALADAWNLLGLLDQACGRHEEALRQFTRALDLRPDFVEAVMNRANSEQALGRADAALAGYARALAMAPRNAAVRYNVAHLHQKALGDYERARDEYRAAIALDPALADAHLNLADVLFALGDFAEGWREFAWRPQRRAYEAALARAGRRYELPTAPSGDVRLRGEQGLGDILFFLRFATTAMDFNGDRRLHPLLERTGRFRSLTDDPSLPADGITELLVGDLPRVVDPGGRTFPPPLALSSKPEARDAMLDRLRRAGPPPWIALTWRAGERSKGLFDRLFKEVPLPAFGSALRGVRATWISIQRAPEEGECETLGQALGASVHDFSDVNADLERALAALDLVDDYVGVSNTNVHLRAGLGRGARVLVPFAPEWRWGLEVASPWFPAMKVYREARGADWTGALAALSRDMRP
jgi:tetratricopeptide (TPR) repeat protein